MYTQADFLSRDACIRIRRAMDRGAADSADVLEAQIGPRESVRRAVSIEIDDALRLEVERQLDAARAAIASYHGLALSDREGAGFIRYPDGGFYRPHRDRAAVASWPDAARRQIAAVIFLNSAVDAEPDGDFSGGALRLFVDALPLEFQPRAGLLVAFPADALHEVAVVRGGIRDAIVDWYYGAPRV